MDDVDMPSAEEGEGGDAKKEELKKKEEEEQARRAQTMPTLPKAPMYHGSTAAEKQKFMKEYEAYCRQLAALETAFFKSFRMPVGACINDESCRLIARFDIRNPVSAITEADWVNYFWEGRINGVLDFDKVKAPLSSRLKMDTMQPDADSRSEAKKVVRYIIDALAPEPFGSVAKKEMERESNKSLLKDVVAFTV
ncbi:hypothetical protein PHPALM_31013 [Phytophthora palmivora]|uniref:Uncharacterized protein n=1 Tax=Phytophthora palmivora TaxID=4796 RepID=A0A2P4X3R0_9STRA|nr:hypothetical protein PHPALM_31013 [Phytophthora palmivora]